MSGAAGLSAAKRRRGAQPQRQQPQAPPPPPATQESSSNAGGLTPMQLLQQHHQRIGHIEHSTQILSDTMSNLSSAGNGEGSASIDAMNEVRGRVDAIEKEMRVRKDEPIEDLGFFRDKTISLEKQVTELKQMMMKIQNFAMETNFTLLRYKNGMEAELAQKMKEAHARASSDAVVELVDDGTFEDNTSQDGIEGEE